MKKLTALMAILLLLQSCIGAGKNSEIEANKKNHFPKITGIDLEGEERELPQSFNNKKNIVIVAFKREQQSEVDTWIPFVEEIMKENSEVSFFEVPLIYELGSFKRAFVNNGMRRGIPSKEARKRTITVYTNREKFFEIMKMQEDKIYVLLLDNKGKILWQTDGIISKEKAKKLEKALMLKSRIIESQR